MSDVKIPVRGTVTIEQLEQMYHEQDAEKKRNLYYQMIEGCVADLQARNEKLQMKLEQSEERCLQYMLDQNEKLRKELADRERRSFNTEGIVGQYSAMLENYSRDLDPRKDISLLEQMSKTIKPLLDDTQKLFHLVEDKIRETKEEMIETQHLSVIGDEVEKPEDFSYFSQSIVTEKSTAFDKQSRVSEADSVNNEKSEDNPFVQLLREVDRKVSRLSSK